VDVSKQDRIQRLFQSYHESLPARMAELDELWAQLISSWDDEMAVSFDTICHSLAGSALTFDCDDVGEIAKQIEIRFKPELENSKPIAEGLRTEIRALLNELSSAILTVNS